MDKKFIFVASLLALISANQTFADPTIVNNNNNNNGGGGNGCTNGMTPGDNRPATPAGTYKSYNSDGSSNTIYTTGDKQPYIVDNNCNTAPVVQPYVNGPYQNQNGGGGNNGNGNGNGNRPMGPGMGPNMGPTMGPAMGGRR